MDKTRYMVFIGATLLYLIYCILSSKNKNIIYVVRSKNMSVQKNDYYKLQSLFCILNCTLLILESIVGYSVEITRGMLVSYFFTFCIVNYLLKFIAVKKNYLNIMKEG